MRRAIEDRDSLAVRDKIELVLHAAHDGLEEEFRLERVLIEARTAAGLLQSQLARRMKTSQSAVRRRERYAVPRIAWMRGLISSSPSLQGSTGAFYMWSNF